MVEDGAEDVHLSAVQAGKSTCIADISRLGTCHSGGGSVGSGRNGCGWPFMKGSRGGVGGRKRGLAHTLDGYIASHRLT